MDRRAATVTALTLLALVAMGIAWWSLSTSTDVAVDGPDRPDVLTITRPAPAPEVLPAEVEEDDEPTAPQQLGPLPELAGRDGSDPEVRAEILDRIEEMEAERLGADEAAERRAVREQMLDRRAHEAAGGH
jgi:hypothetical protein